ncbi:MAG: DUF4097 family beta strand repeat-containing protein [Eubacteriales bacterium]|nr:DUF4097 family beta strand repeat-containing protein [Eubacteriales bacterium]
MSKSAKKWLIAAASLVTIGAILFAAVMTAYHWDFSRLSTDNFETNTYEISEEFSDIKFNTETADILFATSSDGTCRVVCYEKENVKHSVLVQDGTLTVNVVDDRAWNEHIGINYQPPKLTVYLPKTEYASIVIKASTGDIELPNEMKVDSAVISMSTGDIRIHNMSAGTLDLSASTGEIFVSNVTCTGDLKANTTTGDVNLMKVTCQNLFSTGSTSDISLKNVIATGKFSIERSTGDVVFESSDAAEIFVETSTGDVTGSLLTEKTFVAKTSTGNISVPKTTAGGKCEIITSTGDIMFQ